MIYFDTDHEAYQQKETIEKWGKTYLCEYSDEIYNDFLIGKMIWQDNELVINPNWETEELARLKQAKYEEALNKANKYQQEGYVEHKNCVFEMSDSNRKNLSDTEEALKLQGIEETTWLDKDDNYVTLTVEDIQYIRLNLILAAIQKLWITDYPYYKEQIEAANTLEELEAIEITYPREESYIDPVEIPEDNEE